MTGTLNALLAATVAFVAGHFLLSTEALRRPIRAQVGEQGFRAVYSILVLAAFVWMIAAYRAAPAALLWSPPPVFAWIPVLVMPIAIFAAVCGLTTPSATMVGGETRLDDPGVHDPAPGLLRVTRHPFLWGAALWAASHLLINGEAANLIVMGGILVLSLGGMAHIDQRRETAMGAAWGPVKLTTSAVPFVAIATGRTTMDWQGIGWWRPVLAFVLYVALVYLHPVLFGVSARPI